MLFGGEKKKKEEETARLPVPKSLANEVLVMEILLGNPHGVYNVFTHETYVIDPDFDAKTAKCTPAMAVQLAHGLKVTKGWLSIEEIMDDKRRPGSLKYCCGSIPLAEALEDIIMTPGSGPLTRARAAAGWIVEQNPAGEIRQKVNGADGRTWEIVATEEEKGWTVFACPLDEPERRAFFREIPPFCNRYPNAEEARVGAIVMAATVAHDLTELVWE